MALEPGTHFGPYEVTGQIGAGGMGEVYRATDSKLGRDVAIKTLPAALASDKDRLARFEREAKLLASLNHPHIASIYSLDEHKGTMYLAMELIEGETLEEKLKPGAIPVEDALRLALQIAEALEAAHDKGVIHRDLKPANVMVTPDGIIKVLDFGLAKAFSDDPNELVAAQSPALSVAMTQQGLVLGTAGYMSPEQASAQATDQRADIWAFGVVLYEMLTGLPLFSGESVPHILADVLKTEPDWSRLPKNLHPRLKLMLERCLTKKPRNRYHSIADARVDIQGALSDPEGAVIQPVVRVAALAQPLWRRTLLPISTLILGGAAVGLGIWLLLPGLEPGPVVRFPYVLPEGEDFARPEYTMIAVSPDGTRLAYVANRQIYVRNFDEVESRPVDGTFVGTGQGVASPVFSPDGEWLAYIEVVNTAQSILRRVPVSGGTPRTVFEGGNIISPSWPTPNTIVFANNDGIVRIPDNGGAIEVLVARTEDYIFASPQILPDGESVLFTRAGGNAFAAEAFGDDTQIMVQTIGADDSALLWDGGSAPTYLPSGHLIYAQGNTLWGIPFDVGIRAVAGGPVPVVEGVRRSSDGRTDAAHYSVSDSGTLVIIPGSATSQPESRLAFVDTSGNVSPLGVPSGQYHSPRISPNGERIVVEIMAASGQGQIWIYDLVGDSEIRQLTQTGNNTRPIWTPDSGRVTFASERDGSWGIYERSADGSTLAELLTTADQERRQFPDSWSPDDQTLVYTDASMANAEWDLWTFSRSSRDAELFAGGDGNQFLGVFSPEGSWLAYTDTAPPFGIQIQPFPPTGVIHQITDSNEATPVWTVAGDELYFRAAANIGMPSQIMGLEVATVGGITWRNVRTLPIQGALMTIGYRDFDIHPDGDRFVMVYPAEFTSGEAVPVSQIDIVLNWHRELLRLVPTE